MMLFPAVLILAFWALVTGVVIDAALPDGATIAITAITSAVAVAAMWFLDRANRR